MKPQSSPKANEMITITCLPSCQTPRDLEYYPSIDKRKLKYIHVEFQARVGYWAFLTTCRITRYTWHDKNVLLGVSEHLVTTS